MTREDCTCWDYETPDAECHCEASNLMPSTTDMGTDIGPECKACGSTLYTYRVSSYRHTDVSARCASCNREFAFSSAVRLDSVSEVRRHHMALNDEGRL